MSRDPDGQTHLCERCRRNTELYHHRKRDEYLCDDCIAELEAEINAHNL